MDTAKYAENKIDEVNTQLDNSKKVIILLICEINMNLSFLYFFQLWGIEILPKTKNNVRKNFENALGIVTLTFLSCIVLRKVFKIL